MITRGALIFGELLIMLGLVAWAGFLPLSVGQRLFLAALGVLGVVIGWHGGEARARNYFQVMAVLSGTGLVMALGAALAGAASLFGVPLTVGSFLLLVTVVAATFFVGFEPEALDEQPEVEPELAAQRF